MENTYTPPMIRTVLPPERNSVVSPFTRSTKEPVKFTEKASLLNCRTIIPPADHLRTQSDKLQVSDNGMADFFTRYNKPFRLYVRLVKEEIEWTVKTFGYYDSDQLEVAKSFAQHSLGYVGIKSKLTFVPWNGARKDSRSIVIGRSKPTPIWKVRAQRKFSEFLMKFKGEQQ